MLDYDTKRRATAWQSLQHPWIVNSTNRQSSVAHTITPKQDECATSSQATTVVAAAAVTEVSKPSDLSREHEDLNVSTGAIQIA